MAAPPHYFFFAFFFFSGGVFNIRFRTSSGFGFFSSLSGIFVIKIILQHPFKLPKTYYTVIGEITYKWALIEFYIHDMARYFLGIGKREGRVVLYKTGAREKITVLKTTTLEWVSDKASRDHIRSIAKQAYKLNDRRNEIAHGVWGHLEGKTKKLYLVYVTEGKERILPTAVLKSSKGLQVIADEMDTLLTDIAALYINAKIPLP